MAEYIAAVHILQTMKKQTFKINLQQQTAPLVVNYDNTELELDESPLWINITFSSVMTVTKQQVNPIPT